MTRSTHGCSSEARDSPPLSEKEKNGKSAVLKRVERTFERQAALLQENSQALLSRERGLLSQFQEQQEELELQMRSTEDSALLSIDQEMQE